jgi:hypothetical protein
MPNSHRVTNWSLWGPALREIQRGDDWVMKPA